MNLIFKYLQEKLPLQNTLAVVLPTVLIAFFLFCKVINYYIVDYLLLCVLLVCVIVSLFQSDLHKSGYEPNLIDFSICLVLITEAVNYFVSSYQTNSFYSFRNSFWLFVFYFVVRFVQPNRLSCILILLLIGAVGVRESVTALNSFWSNYNDLHSLGFENISEFKTSLRGIDLDVPSGEWVSLFIALIALPSSLLTVAKTKRLLCVLILAYQILVCYILVISFSRGVYIAVICCFILAACLLKYFKIYTLRQVLFYSTIFGALLTAAVGFSSIATPTYSTVQLFSTTSQVRSFEGRSDIWRASFKMFLDNPIVGVGSNNFGLQYITYKEPDAAVVRRPFNIGLQLLAEKGIIGFTAYLTLFIAVIRRCFSSLKDDKLHVFWRGFACLSAATLVSLVVRDTSYSSILNNEKLLLVLCLNFAFLSNIPSYSYVTSSSKKSRGVTSIIFKYFVILACVLFAFIINHYVHVELGARSFSAYSFYSQREDFAKAYNAIKTANENDPKNAFYISNRAIALARLIKNDLELVAVLNQKIELSDFDQEMIRDSIALFRRAVDLNANDSSVHHNLGWLYLVLGEEELAKQSFNQAVSLEQDSVYLISLGLYYEHYENQESANDEYIKAVVDSPGVVNSKFYGALKSRNPNASQKILDESIRIIEKRLEEQNDPILKAKLGKLYLSRGMPEKAIHYLNDSRSQLQNLPKVWLNIGYYHEIKGEQDDALKCYLKASFLDKSDSIAAYYLGRQHLLRNDLEKTLVCYKLSLFGFNKEPTTQDYQNSRLYLSKSVVTNSYVISDLLHYFKEELNRKEVCETISQIYLELGDHRQSRYYESLAANF